MILDRLFKESFQQFKSIVSQVSKWLQELPKVPEVIPVMTYESAIQYFVTDRPPDPRVKKGVILRQPHSQGQRLVQVFLDANNQLVHSSDGKPYGRQLVTRELDAELWDAFDNQDLIIME